MDKINSLWVIMLIIFTVSVLASYDFYRSYFEYMRYIAYFLIFIGIRNHGAAEKIFRFFYIPVILVNAIILSFLAILYSIHNLQLPTPHTMTLFYPSFGHNHIADILIFAIPVAISQTILQKRPISKIFWSVLNIFLIFIMVLSLGRIAMISLVISLCIFAFLFKTEKLYKWNILLGVLVVFVLIFTFIVSNVSPNYGSSIFLVQRLYRPFANDYHLINDYQAIMVWMTKPVFGIGLNNFKLVAKIIPPTNNNWYTHNHYLEILSETGLVGAIIFISLILAVFYRSCKLLIKSDGKFQFMQRSAILISLFATCVQSLFDYQWHFISIFFLFWLGLSLSISKEYGLESDHKNILNIFFFIVITLSIFIFLPPFNNLHIMY